jgi:hypothetical protein
MYFQVMMTFLFVWFVAGLVALIFKSNEVRPNFLVGVGVLVTAVLVGYMWDVGHLVH